MRAVYRENKREKVQTEESSREIMKIMDRRGESMRGGEIEV